MRYAQLSLDLCRVKQGHDKAKFALKRLLLEVLRNRLIENMLMFVVHDHFAEVVSTDEGLGLRKQVVLNLVEEVFFVNF